MKKKFIALCVVFMLFTLSLFGCNGNSFSKISISGRQDTDYVVTSNGGSAVQYGNYVYFINGTRSWEDDGTMNKWGEVVKGSLYRAELNGQSKASAYGDNIKDFEIQYNQDTGLEFKSTLGYIQYDDEENEIEKQEIVDVQQLAPKTIGTSGFAAGGIFIFDDAVYYASPNNEKNKQGVIQYNKTDFFRTTLDGQNTVKLYTTETDTSNMPYKFYKQGNYVYLVVFENPDVVSIKIQGNKVVQKMLLSEEATSVTFPSQSVYYKGIDTNTLEDYVYICREFNDDDNYKMGNVIEVMRPDGKERVIVVNDGNDVSIEGVRDGMLFYRSVENGLPAIVFTNLHDILMDLPDNIPAKDRAYYIHQKYLLDNGRALEMNSQINGTLMASNSINNFTATYAFRPNRLSNIVYLLAADSSGLWCYQSSTNVSWATGHKIVSGEVNLVKIEGSHVYYSKGENEYYYTNVFVSESQKTDADYVKITGVTKPTSSLSVDICAGYFVYFANFDQWASDYTFFQKIPGMGVSGTEAKFVGERAEEDLKPEDEDDDDDYDYEDENEDDYDEYE